MESRKVMRKRSIKHKRSLFVQKGLGITAALASTSGVFTSLVHATETTSSTSNSATATLSKSSSATTINQQFKTTASLNVRASASTNASIVDGVAANTTVKAVAKQSGTSVNGNTTWYKLSTGGWISGAYVQSTSASSSSTANASTASSSESAISKSVKTTAALNVRSNAQTSASVVRGLSANATVKVVAQKSGTSVNGNTTWYKLSSGGWITAAYVQNVSSSSSTNTSNNNTSTAETTISKNVKTTSALNVRSSASTSGRVVGSLSNSTTVKVVAQKSGTTVGGTNIWYKLSTGGWITAAYTQAVSSSTTNNSSNSGNTSSNTSTNNNTSTAKEQAISKNLQTTTSINVRSDASTTASVVSSLSSNATVKAVAQKQGTTVSGTATWYKLSSGGWVTAAYVKEVSSSSNTGNSSSNTNVSTSVNGAAIVAEARKYIGTPYQWGGKGPDVFDCSGFTRYVFLQVTGKNIGDWTVPQESAGTIIPVSQAQAGDLLFWGEKGNTYHVAIATSNSSYIHAPSTGYTVTEAKSGFGTASFALRVK
ncbi:C40 family peptidase [Enterococcus sp.]|uniref:C40 family peptidase n=1 Tax=Enterococcus sp. TaxID=35783 RepID=UPI0028AAA1AD|nr:SH3 domain-containing protein [Enterococcus sp.]